MGWVVDAAQNVVCPPCEQGLFGTQRLASASLMRKVRAVTIGWLLTLSCGFDAKPALDDR